MPVWRSIRLHQTELLFVLGQQHYVTFDHYRVYYTNDTDYFYKPIFFVNHSNVTRHFVARFIDQFFDEFLNLFPTLSCMSNSGVSSIKELMIILNQKDGE
jgi:hypothetical protein